MKCSRCQNLNVNWFNIATRLYVCESCAKSLNEKRDSVLCFEIKDNMPMKKIRKDSIVNLVRFQRFAKEEKKDLLKFEFSKKFLIVEDGQYIYNVTDKPEIYFNETE